MATEHELIYQGIVALAAVCDGAQSKDFQGFNGVDTHFGRRIASVPADEWNADVYDEAAHIILKYRDQVLALTGIDVATLKTVRDAQDQGTNHAARNQARRYERLAETLAARRIDVVNGGQLLGIFYDKRDPDFGLLLEACKALPGRQFDWNLKANVVAPSEALDDFILTWDFPVTDAALALLAQPRAVKYAVYLADNGKRVVIDTPYDAALVERIRQLPGRAWDGANKLNTANLSPAVVDLVIDFGLKCHPDARSACERAGETLKTARADALDAGDRAVLLAHVSEASDPDDLPVAFLDLLKGVLGNV